MFHLGRCVKQRIVHVDIYHLRPAFDLTRRYPGCFLVVFLLDKTQEAARAGNVATFAYVEEIVFGPHLNSFQSGQAQRFIGRMDNSWSTASGCLFEACNVFRCSAAAATYDIDKAFVEQRCYGVGERFGRFAITTQFIGQSRIGMAADGKARFCGLPTKMWHNVGGAHRTV